MSIEEQRNSDIPHSQEEKQPSLADMISPDHLQMVSRASGGFLYALDPDLPPERMGYTNLETKTIHINPSHLSRLPQSALEGFFFHEGGHHAPEAVAFQDLLLENLSHVEIPENYNASPQTQEKFLQAIHSNLHNALADIWLESFMSRRPYYPINNAFNDLYASLGQRETLKNLSKPEQLTQLLVGEARYGSDIPLSDLVDSAVYQAYERLLPAMKTLQDRWAFESFGSPAEKNATIQRKFLAYEQAFLPEFLKLIEKELQEGEKQSSDSQSEKQDKLNKLLDKLIESGKQFESIAPSKETIEKEQETFEQIKEKLKDQEQAGSNKNKQEKPEEKLRDIAERLRRERQESEQRSLADAMHVKQEAIQKWQEIKEQEKDTIKSLASNLADVFLDNRRKKIAYLLREGDMVPGLEYETIAALLTGEPDPDTKMRVVQNPEFLETEIEFLVDTSGSMSGEKLEKSISLMVSVTEAFKQILSDLESENLVRQDENPFRIGVTKFDTTSQRVTTLEEPLSDQKEVEIIDQVSQTGGGTDETDALKDVYKSLSSGQSNIIKIMITLTDGDGSKGAIAPIMQQIESDDEIIFLAVGLGKSQREAENIVDTYISPLRKEKNQTNVFGIAATNPLDILPAVTDFLRQQVEKRRQD